MFSLSYTLKLQVLTTNGSSLVLATSDETPEQPGPEYTVAARLKSAVVSRVNSKAELKFTLGFVAPADAWLKLSTSMKRLMTSWPHR